MGNMTFISQINKIFPVTMVTLNILTSPDTLDIWLLLDCFVDADFALIGFVSVTTLEIVEEKKSSSSSSAKKELERHIKMKLNWMY